MSSLKTDYIFTNLKMIIDKLVHNSFLTIDDGYFYNLHVLILRSLYIRLNRAIKSNVLEFDDAFYEQLFRFRINKSEYPTVPQNDPFYPLLEQIKNFVSDVVSYKDYYETMFIKNEQPSISEPRLLTNIIRYRKLFLKDVTELMCDKYTIKLKNIDTRKVVDGELKAIIDNVFSREIEGQHILLFDDVDDDTKATKDYTESCKYLKILKNPVNEICTIFTDETARNKTQMDLLNHFVQGCSEDFSTTINETTTKVPFPTKTGNLNNNISRHQRSLLSSNESKNVTKNMGTHLLPLGGLFGIFSLMVVLIFMFKKSLWK